MQICPAPKNCAAGIVKNRALLGETNATTSVSSSEVVKFKPTYTGAGKEQKIATVTTTARNHFSRSRQPLSFSSEFNVRSVLTCTDGCKVTSQLLCNQRARRKVLRSLRSSDCCYRHFKLNFVVCQVLFHVGHVVQNWRSLPSLDWHHYRVFMKDLLLQDRIVRVIRPLTSKNHHVFRRSGRLRQRTRPNSLSHDQLLIL